MISVIKTAAHYDEVLNRVTSLVAQDPQQESAAGHELEVLTVLLQEYERGHYALASPSPLAAIRLRMEQRGLSPRDLIPYLGSRSKVSEVLAGKRPLSLAMIRALHAGLDISLESLVSEQQDDAQDSGMEWDRFPLREMIKRGWLSPRALQASQRISFSNARDLMENFMQPLGGPSFALGVLHKADHVRTARSSDRYALAAWACYVRRRAEATDLSASFRLEDWGPIGLRDLRTLSRFDVGPRLAVQYLEERGIVVDVVPHLPRTRLDGAALMRSDGTPVIALTIRHDRMDNFWFTLFHELMHVLLHLANGASALRATECFLDDLDVVADVSPFEEQADRAARDALIPPDEWQSSAVRFAVGPPTVSRLAQELGVSDAVVAGRVRFERRNYRLLAGMIGAGEVRKLFPEVNWAAAK